MHDVLVMGADMQAAQQPPCLPAEASKAILIERSQDGQESPCADWLCEPGFELLKELGIDCTAQLGEPFAGMTFHSADLGKTAQSVAAAPPGWRIDHPAVHQPLAPGRA